jgi:hypothetical protein
MTEIIDQPVWHRARSADEVAGRRAAVVRSRKSAQAQDLPRNDFIVHIDRSSPATAFAKVQCWIPPRYFTDYLTFVKLSGGWKIVSKTYHTETR